MSSGSGPVNLLICSIGNPGKRYLFTRHSVGHVVLNRFLEEHAELVHNHRVIKSEVGSLLEGNSRLNNFSMRHRIAFFRSESYMNVSGIGVAQAWKYFSQKYDNSKLIVLHDDLELEVGKFKLKRNGSARGHNGLKSIAQHLSTTEILKYGIGIGRPVSRESKIVADYVLSKMTSSELDTVQNAVYGDIWLALAEQELGTAV
ncbi:peptidyl-tRNA hydrolase [Lipomyces japonicus]|uniref:peptidyl-tRNA hydrolase n=1 Tax=Lipomyces japonicus TaxID=56871 RepID=UPI0034D01E7C